MELDQLRAPTVIWYLLNKRSCHEGYFSSLIMLLILCASFKTLKFVVHIYALLFTLLTGLFKRLKVPFDKSSHTSLVQRFPSFLLHKRRKFVLKDVIDSTHWRRRLYHEWRGALYVKSSTTIGWIIKRKGYCVQWKIGRSLHHKNGNLLLRCYTDRRYSGTRHLYRLILTLWFQRWLQLKA